MCLTDIYIRRPGRGECMVARTGHNVQKGKSHHGVLGGDILNSCLQPCLASGFPGRIPHFLEVGGVSVR